MSIQDEIGVPSLQEAQKALVMFVSELAKDESGALSRPIRDVMTRNPKRIDAEHLASEAMAMMHQHRFDELPVVDVQDRPVGLIDVQDLVVLKMLDVEPET